jgi:hypothetical protein
MGRAQGKNSAAASSPRALGHETAVTPPVLDADELYEQQCADNEEWLSGWASTHDYDPTWDYTVSFQHRQHPLLLLAETVLERVCADAATNPHIPFASGRVFPVELEGAAAMFVSGTSSEPVVLVDINTHLDLDERDQERAIADSVLHELRHAVQEAYDLPLDEDEAEHGSLQMPF